MEREVTKLINRVVQGPTTPHEVRIAPEAGQTFPPTMVLKPAKPTKSAK